MNRQLRVTLVAIDTAFHDLTRLALLDTLRAIEPREILVFSDRDIGLPGAKTLPCAVKSNAEAERFMWDGVHHHVNTPHVLMIQWDSGIVHPLLWDDAFLSYDYIGAPWPWHKDGLDVGNGGFTLRSLRLMDQVSRNDVIYPFAQPEDHYLCRVYRRHLEQGFALRWAPPDLAAKFSVEHGDWPSWGYHGLWNWVRFLNDGDLAHRLSLLPKTINREREDFKRLVAFAQAYNRQDTVMEWLKTQAPGA